MFNPNSNTAKLIGSKQSVSLSIGSVVGDTDFESDNIKPEFDSYKKSHVVKLTLEPKSRELVSARFLDEGMNHLPIGENIEKRVVSGTKTLKEISGRNIAVIIRAVDSYTNTFKNMDYVITHNMLPTKDDVTQAVMEILDEDDAKSPGAKRLLWAARHAQSMAASYSRPQHVIAAVVHSKDVMQATNEGEWFYNGNTKEGRVILSFDEEGSLVKNVDKENQLTP